MALDIWTNLRIVHVDLNGPSLGRPSLISSSANIYLYRTTLKSKADLQNMIPEEQDGDHDKTVAKLNSSERQEIEWELSKILLYKLSNKMQVGQLLEDGLKDDAVLKMVKLAAQNNLEWLASVAASEESTAIAIAENVFAVAIRQCNLQITSQLLK
ncbi:hypothetical protein CHU98_g6483 [Xylaria longipes]|nr:hypothetical protein CHU98_g6483 [Xylaria longipes]